MKRGWGGVSPLLRMRPPPSWGRGGRAHGEVRGVGGPPLPGPPITRKLAVFSETSTNRPSEAPEVKTSPPGGLQVVLEVEVVTGARGLRCREVYKSPPRKPRRSTSRPGRSTSRHPAAQVAPGRSRSRSRKPRRSTNRPPFGGTNASGECDRLRHLHVASPGAPV